MMIEVSVMPPLIASPAIGSTNLDNISKFAVLADEYGFDAILFQDHIGIKGATIYDCLTTLASVASRTKNIHVGTLATPIPLRHPAIVAKALANIDIISGGRAVLTAGAGWVKEDFVWYGLPWRGFKDRIRMMKEGIKVIKMLWTQSPADFEGEFYTLNEADLQPKPVQKPHPPVWVAGNSYEALETAVEEADGWFGWIGISPDEFAERVGLVDTLCSGRGRSRSEVKNGMHIQASIALSRDELKKQAERFMAPIEKKTHHEMISCGTPEYFVRLIQQYVDAGLDHFNIVFVPVDKAVEQIKIFGEKVLPSFR